jgi:hypothetical protein
MIKRMVYSKPSVADTTWSRIFFNDGVIVYESDKFYDFYKVVANNTRAKYFFGELAWNNAERYAVDNSDFSAYGCTS